MYNIYRIDCIVSKKSYIGLTKQKLFVRLNQHFREANNKKNKKYKIHYAILKYKENNFTIKLLDTADDLKTASFKEIYYISLYNTYYNGYNSSKGGQTGGYRSKIVSNTGSNNPFYGKKHSKESKIKIGNRDYSNQSGSKNHQYGKPFKSAFKSGEDHPFSKTVFINGIKFGSISKASEFLNIKRHILYKKFKRLNIQRDIKYIEQKKYYYISLTPFSYDI